MLRILKFIGLILILAPIALFGRCAYLETSQRNNLKSLCESSNVRKNLSITLNEAEELKFRVRSKISDSKGKLDWFDRTYNRIIEHAKKKGSLSAYTIIFAKPGIGYYACIIEHEHDTIIYSQYVDRSS